MNCLQTFGIDISSYSKDIDWQKTIANLNPRFVFARAYHVDATPEGSYEDQKFATDYWPALAQLGLPRGAYLFCHPKADAADSIQKFFNVYKPRVGDLLPTLDIEDIYDNSSGVPVQKRIAQIDAMVQLVSAKIGGQKPMIYTKKRVWDDLGNPRQFADCPLWVLNYKTMPTVLNMPATWPAFTFWQYAENLKVDGIGGDYDPDLFNGTEGELGNYAIKRVIA
jgi:GH25 family lysozyme M1 (1,4-beta-N-acetylmuramidase)